MLFSEPLQSIRELTFKFSLTARFYFRYSALMGSFRLLEFLGEEMPQRISKAKQFHLRLDLLYQLRKSLSIEADLSLSAWKLIFIQILDFHPLGQVLPPCAGLFCFLTTNIAQTNNCSSLNLILRIILWTRLISLLYLESEVYMHVFFKHCYFKYSCFIQKVTVFG